MPADSWIAPDHVPALAALATARIDEALSRLTETDRTAFWASVRKCYNTPYNDPKPRALPRVAMSLPHAPEMGAPEATALSAPALVAALATLPGAFSAEPHAA
jgi:hypothetical protein